MGKDNRLLSDEELRNNALAFIAISDRSRCANRESFSRALASNKGYRFSSSGVYEYTSELLRHLDSVIRRSVDLIGSTLLDEQTVEAGLWRVVDKQLVGADAFKEFVAEIYGDLNVDYRYVMPNHQIRFEEGLTQLKIGPVGAVLGDVIASEINQGKKNPNWRVEVRHDDPPSSDGVRIAGIDAVCWEVQVRASEGSVENEAIWMVDIALSLLRLLYPPSQQTGYFPGYDQVECKTGTRPTIRSRNLLLSDDGISFGGWGLPPHYLITRPVAAIFDSEETKEIATALFQPPEKSVAERVARGLGWLTRGRQAHDKAERYLYFFTALETLLTLEGAAIVGTIARHVSVLLMKAPSDRFRASDEVKKAYGIRSRLVHEGKRNVSWYKGDTSKSSLRQLIGESLRM